jgi:hypothetical protein
MGGSGRISGMSWYFKFKQEIKYEQMVFGRPKSEVGNTVVRVNLTGKKRRR